MRKNSLCIASGKVFFTIQPLHYFFSQQFINLTVMPVWYNFIRKRQGIGMTPSQMAGIDLHLQKNKLLGLIYLSSLS